MNIVLDSGKLMPKAIQTDAARIRDHFGEIVRGTVEETLNAVLDADAGRLWPLRVTGEARFGRISRRQEACAGLCYRYRINLSQAAKSSREDD